MMLQRAIRVLSVVMLAAAIGFVSAGCSTPPKPKELNELEDILQDPESRKVKDAPGASKYYRESRQYRRVALQAYESGEVEQAKSYAILGKLRYRTAAAIAEQHKAKQRLDEMNAKVSEVNPQLQTLQQERDKLSDGLVELRSKVAQARRKQAEEERRAAARQKTDINRNASTDAAEREAAQNQIDAAEKARSEALKVKANELAKGTYNRAENSLKSARQMYADNQASDSVVSTARKAADLFDLAAQKARPKFDEQQQKMEPSARRQAMREDARNKFGEPFTVTERNGVRVVLAMMFDKGSGAVRPSSRPLFNAALELAKKYEEATIRIEGYTRRGNATQNLATSQLRARNVRDMMTAEGIDKGRISTTGLGQEQRRYPDDPEKNDRVEIIFTIPSK
jgi:outer membrane protein OmpA-like peptidoglycan-associated protein